MKRGITKLLFLTAIALGLAVACTPDRERGGGSDDGDRRLSSLTVENTYTEDDYTETNRTILEVTWSGSRIKKVTGSTWNSRTAVERTALEATPTYSGGKLSAIEVYNYAEDESMTFACNYANNRLTSIAGQYNDEERDLVSLEYNTDGMISVVSVYDNGEYYLTWNGANIVRGSDGEGDYVTIKYDRNYFPLTDILQALLNSWSGSMNCPVKVTSPNGESMAITYTYDGVYPLTATIANDDDEQVSTIYFEYTDGTGGVPSSGSGGSTGGGGSTTDERTITVRANNDDYGYVTGGGTYEVGTSATLEAIPYEGYRFVEWQDGNTANPRRVSVQANRTYTAYFEEEEEYNRTTEPSISVTFGSNTWDATDIQAILYDNNILWLYADSDPSDTLHIQYPGIRLLRFWGNNQTASTGSITAGVTLSYDSENGQNYSWADGLLVEYFESEIIQLNDDGNLGDWINKSATLNITSLNIVRHTISGTIVATMGHTTELSEANNWNGITTRQLRITFTDVPYRTASLTSKASSNPLFFGPIKSMTRK